MQLYNGSPFVDALAQYLHVVWQTWLTHILTQGNIPPETRVIVSTTVVNRWKKLASLSYGSLTRPEKEPYRNLAAELEEILSKDFIILPKADYENKVRVEVLAKLGEMRAELVDVLIFARAEALGSKQEIVQQATKSLNYLYEVSNGKHKN